jgi:hypothetical protein
MCMLSRSFSWFHSIDARYPTTDTSSGQIMPHYHARKIHRVDRKMPKQGNEGQEADMMENTADDEPDATEPYFRSGEQAGFHGANSRGWAY